MSEKSVILLEEISSSQADTESIFRASGTDIAISHHLPCAPEEKVVVERCEENPGGVPEQLVFGGRGETDEEAGTEADIKDEDIDVVYGAPELVVCVFESEGFIFSEIVSRKGLGDRLCLRVLLTPLDFRNVSFQIFKR